jgi:hypothetical protein
MFFKVDQHLSVATQTTVVVRTLPTGEIIHKVVCGDTDNGRGTMVGTKKTPTLLSKIGIIRYKISVILKKLYRETLPATAGAACIRVMKVKPFAIKAVRKVKLGASQIQE